MGVLWTLSEGGAMTFRELQERCETISPSVLNQRLSELKEAGFVTRSERGYIPTALGERIYRHLVPLGSAAREWSDALVQDGPDQSPIRRRPRASLFVRDRFVRRRTVRGKDFPCGKRRHFLPDPYELGPQKN